MRKAGKNKWHGAGAAVPTVYILPFGSFLSRNDDIWGVATVQERINADETPTQPEQGCLTQWTNKGLVFGEAVRKPLFQPMARRSSFSCESDATQPLCVTFSCSGMLILTQTNLQRFSLLLEPLIKIVIFRETKQGLARRTSSHVQHFHNTSYFVTCHWPQNGDVPQYPCLHSVCSVFTVLLYVQVGAASGGDSRRKGENCPLHQVVLVCRTQLVGSIQIILCIAHFMMLNSI